MSKENFADLINHKNWQQKNAASMRFNKPHKTKSNVLQPKGTLVHESSSRQLITYQDTETPFVDRKTLHTATRFSSKWKYF